MAKNKCKDCNKRTIECHNTCEDYKKFKEKLEKEKKARNYYRIKTSNNWGFFRKGKKNAK